MGPNSTDTKLKISARAAAHVTHDLAPSPPVGWLQPLRGTGSTTYGRDSLMPRGCDVLNKAERTHQVT
jgi:hypothetical protein